MDALKCKWCSAEIEGRGATECDRCWELRHRIEMDMALAERITESLKITMQQNATSDESKPDHISMKLFELTTGKTGHSYERSYAWCKDKDEAKQMFKARFNIEPDRIELLLRSKEPAFITDLSDKGWSNFPF